MTTYSQNWTEYNQAQTNEKHLFLDIAQELVSYITHPKHVKGRPSINTQDIIASLLLLSYNGKSSRRTISELKLAKANGFVQTIPHFNTILSYFNSETITTHLKNLLTLSSMPLQALETDFAIDSSGFATNHKNTWHTHKWINRDEPNKNWKKVHLISGIKTNIITHAIITDSTINDTTQLKTLVDKTAEHFTLNHVSADKAYLSRTNLDVIAHHGATPFIPFRKGSTRKSKGSTIWKKMYDYYEHNYDTFMYHYHKRSNAETVFSMIKRKFGNTLRTKKDNSQENEILCKCICHNITVLIHELYELNINLDFTPSFKLPQSSQQISAKPTPV